MDGVFELLIDRLNRMKDPLDRLLDHLEHANPGIESNVERIRFPTQRETEEVHQRVTTEFIEARENRPRPASPNSITKMLQKVEIDKIPEGQYRICLDDFQAEMELYVIIPCSHVFHKACIMKWLEENHFCPMCRFTFPMK